MFVLVHQTARNRAKAAIDAAPDGYVVTLKEPTRNLEQNALLHAELQEIAEAREWVGKKWSVEQWKRLLTAAWCRATKQGVQLVPALDGQGVDVLYQRTSELTKAECSDLIEFIRAWKETGHG